ncbi:MAG: hypothetical protein J0L70_06415 [Leptolyngbya sp. UWPOB_LEPTO1]|uniref:hypothetical protein n=1 Tax=Leptolyngbya sp. UWPOB_LEPTO1 TaxID=2815653 RepID=UPI001AC1410D|nr:hypothetical protein [Leptolyngbya sp. UWPOB_LEPTO1]MBN8560138.1 hypothetical protein [Leptolyngbya sp. UWPOB_LEPTO1]
MKTLKFLLIAAGSTSLLFLGACSSGSNQASAPANSPAASSSPATSSSPSANHDADHKAGGGIVVESGAYHLELKPEKEGGETHLDLFVQKGDNHETIPTAKVTAQVQLPDGSQQTVPMNYDADGKHYTAKLSSTAAGEYKVAVQSEIGSEKVNARYTFKL